MRIGTLAARANIAPSRIRFYETHGLLAAPARQANGYRDYPENAVEILQLIDQAQDLGFSLSEIKAGLAQAGAGALRKRDMITALREKLRSLDHHIAEVTRRRARIVAIIAQMERDYPEAT